MIVVTGGAGYIGSHACVNLLEHGFDVLCIDSLELSHIETVNMLKNISMSHFYFEKIDLKNKEDLTRVFDKYSGQIDAVMHFAAYSQVEESVKYPGKYFRNNVVSSLNLFEVMIEHGIYSIIFSSTCSTYGQPPQVPIDESCPQNPVNPYGMSKLMIEKILATFDTAHGLKSIKLRYFNVIGADARGRIGEWHTPETHLLPRILKSYFNEGATFNIYGDDYDTDDGTCVRDYVNVEDLAEAHRLAYTYLMENKVSDAFNLGTEKGSSVKEIFDICSKVTAKKLNVVVTERRAGDCAKLYADASKAKSVLGWKITRTLEDSVRSAYAWEQKLQGIIKYIK